MNINYTRWPERGRAATSVALAASTTAGPYLVERMHGFSICVNVVWASGTLAGTLKLQASNNCFADNVNNDLNSAAVWADIPSMTAAVSISSASTVVFFNVADVNYEAVRIVWTSTSGTGSATPYFLAKG